MFQEQIEELLKRELTFKELDSIEVGKGLYAHALEVIYNTFEDEIAEEIMDAIIDDRLFI